MSFPVSSQEPMEQGREHEQKSSGVQNLPEGFGASETQNRCYKSLVSRALRNLPFRAMYIHLGHLYLQTDWKGEALSR